MKMCKPIKVETMNDISATRNLTYSYKGHLINVTVTQVEASDSVVTTIFTKCQDTEYSEVHSINKYLPTDEVEFEMSDCKKCVDELEEKKEAEKEKIIRVDTSKALNGGRPFTGRFNYDVPKDRVNRILNDEVGRFACDIPEDLCNIMDINKMAKKAYDEIMKEWEVNTGDESKGQDTPKEDTFRYKGYTINVEIDRSTGKSQKVTIKSNGLDFTELVPEHLLKNLIDGIQILCITSDTSKLSVDKNALDPCIQFLDNYRTLANMEDTLPKELDRLKTANKKLNVLKDEISDIIKSLTDIIG